MLHRFPNPQSIHLSYLTPESIAMCKCRRSLRGGADAQRTGRERSRNRRVKNVTQSARGGGARDERFGMETVAGQIVEEAEVHALPHMREMLAEVVQEVVVCGGINKPLNVRFRFDRLTDVLVPRTCLRHPSYSSANSASSCPIRTVTIAS